MPLDHSAVYINWELEVGRFSQCIARSDGYCGHLLRRLPRCFQREKTHPMCLIEVARRISEATCSHDFIYSVTTLFAQLRLYLLATPCAKDRRVQDHRDLNHPIAEPCGKSLLPGLVDRQKCMAQSEVELLDESCNERREQRQICDALSPRRRVEGPPPGNQRTRAA